nr:MULTISPECIES: hypothetical protein [Protofrankia]
MSVVYTITFVLLSVAGLLTLARALVEPTNLDRIVAMDVFVILIVAGVAVEIGMPTRAGTSRSSRSSRCWVFSGR